MFHKKFMTKIYLLCFTIFVSFSLFKPTLGFFNGDLCISEADAQISYKSRVKMTIDAGIIEGLDCSKAWNPGHCSIWVAGACFTSNDSKVIKAGYQVAATALTPNLQRLFEGGNDGWNSFAVGDIFLRYRKIIENDQTLYPVPTAFDRNITEWTNLTVPKEIKLSEMFRIVLTYSNYRQIDSTSNHETTNSVARFLAEQAFPGRIVNGYNKKKNDTGESTILRRCKGILTAGIGEYGSPNYIDVNFSPYLSVAQLTDPKHPNYKNITNIAANGFKSAILQIGAFWFRGNMAMTCGRGYPSTSVWGGPTIVWLYDGGNFPIDSIENKLSFSAGIKSLELLAALASDSGFQMDSLILQIGQCNINRITKATYSGNHLSSYITPEYAHYSESRKAGGMIWQASWSSRIVFLIKNPTWEKFQPVFLITNPNSQYIDRVTLKAQQLSGSGSYSQFYSEENLQSLDTVLHSYRIPADNSSYYDQRGVRGAIIYVPIPNIFVKKLTWNFNVYRGANDGEGFKYPVFLDNNRKMFVGYDSVFIAIISSSPISLGTVFNHTLCVGGGWRNIYNVYGNNSSPGSPSNPNVTVHFAIGVETASPNDFAGKDINEKFDNFVQKYSQIAVPVEIGNDEFHPVFQYVNAKGMTMTSKFAYRTPRGDMSYNYQDWLGLDWGTNKTLVDYRNWPFLSSQTVQNGTIGDYLVNIPQSADAVGIQSFENGLLYDDNSGN